MRILTVLAHGFRALPHLHWVGTHGKFAVRHGQPRPVPFFCLVLQADLHVQKILAVTASSVTSSLASGSAIF